MDMIHKQEGGGGFSRGNVDAVEDEYCLFQIWKVWRCLHCGWMVGKYFSKSFFVTWNLMQ